MFSNALYCRQNAIQVRLRSNLITMNFVNAETCVLYQSTACGICGGRSYTPKILDIFFFFPPMLLSERLSQVCTIGPRESTVL